MIPSFPENVKKTCRKMGLTLVKNWADGIIIDNSKGLGLSYHPASNPEKGMILTGHRLIITLFAGALGIWEVRRRRIPPERRSLCWLLFLLPFCVGGYHQLGCALVSIFLLVLALERGVSLRVNETTVALLALTVFGGLGFLWGADRGMAAWGLVRFLPVLLYGLVLSGLKPEERGSLLDLLPVSGVYMTVITLGMSLFPALSGYVTVADRLAGFFEYPNAYAAFLLAGLVVSATAENRGRKALVTDLILVFGIFQSGSRTALLVMLFLQLLVLIRNRDFGILGILALCFGLSLLPGLLGGETSADRYLTISANSSTLLGRILYAQDALPLILKHPLGLGYLGYQAVQGSVQTGVYTVAHVHNWLLQLLLDTGWVPALLLVWAFVRNFCSKTVNFRTRLLMMAILGHGLLDFDLEFLIFWLILLPGLDLDRGKTVKWKKKGLLAAAGVALTAVVLWLGLADGLFRMGKVEQCLSLTPFHTQALEYRLTQIGEAGAVEETADRILALKPSSSLAYSAKAKVAFARGEINRMIPLKQEAIARARYSIAEYCDYFDQVYQAYQWYASKGSTDSARICLNYLMQIPTMLQDLELVTSQLAWRLDEKPQLTLPEEYRILLAQLAGGR